MSDEIAKTLITRFLMGVLKIEKNYAHELTGVRDRRRNELKDFTNKFVAENIEKK